MEGTSTNNICQYAYSQLALFTNASSGNTLLDYDVHPKFVHKQDKCVSLVDLSHHGFLTVSIGDGSFEIIPAQMQRKSVETDKFSIVAIYPSTREAVIEECLIHFATRGEFSIERGEPGFRFDGTSIRVYFTLHQLRSYLNSMGKSYKASELREGLTVLSLAKYRIKTPDFHDREQLCSYIVQSLDHIDNEVKTDVLRGDRIYCVTLDSRATKKILEGHYRSYDAELSLSLRSPVARYVYKKMTQGWLNACMKGPGSMHILRLHDTLLMSGYPLSTNITKRKLALQNALDELVEARIIQPLSESDITQRKSGRKVVDLDFCVRPTANFVTQQIQGHQISRQAREIGSLVSTYKVA